MLNFIGKFTPMKLHRYIATVVLFIALFFTKLSAQTVYITESGKKYHAKNCSAVKTGKKGIELKEAQKQGYEPCKFCKVAAAEKEEKVKTGQKKEGGKG
jgi:hypothetical protein